MHCLVIPEFESLNRNFLYLQKFAKNAITLSFQFEKFLMAFMGTSYCTNESRKDETCLQFGIDKKSISLSTMHDNSSSDCFDTEYRAFRLVVRSSFVFASSNCDWPK